MTTPTQAQIGPVPGETLDDLRIIASGLLADGIDISKLTNVGRAELRHSIDRILALHAAVQVGEAEKTMQNNSRHYDDLKVMRKATIERCKQVAANCELEIINPGYIAARLDIVAALDKLKDE